MYSLAGVLAPLVVGQSTTGAHVASGCRTGCLLTAVTVAVTAYRPRHWSARGVTPHG